MINNLKMPLIGYGIHVYETVFIQLNFNSNLSLNTISAAFNYIKIYSVNKSRKVVFYLPKEFCKEC